MSCLACCAAEQPASNPEESPTRRSLIWLAGFAMGQIAQCRNLSADTLFCDAHQEAHAAFVEEARKMMI